MRQSNHFFIFCPNYAKTITSSYEGGAEKQLILLTKELNKKGHIVSILTEKPHLKIKKSPNINYQFYNPKTKFFLLYFNLKIIRSIITRKPNYIFLRAPSNIHLFFVLISFLFNIKIVANN